MKAASEAGSGKSLRAIWSFAFAGLATLAIAVVPTVLWTLAIPRLDADYARYLGDDLLRRALAVALPYLAGYLPIALVWGALAHPPARYLVRRGWPALVAVVASHLAVAASAFGFLLALRPGARNLAAHAITRTWPAVDGYAMLPGGLLTTLAVGLLAFAFWSGRAAIGACPIRPKVVLATGGVLLLLGVFLAGIELVMRIPWGKPSGRPNFLIVAGDSLRADRLGLYGHPRETSPKIDRWAKRAAVFENAFASAGGTLESWATILTGRTPPAHGLRYKFPSPASLARFATIEDRVPVRLGAAGYWNAVVSDWAGDPFRLADFGFDEVACPDVARLETFLGDSFLRYHPLLALVYAGTPLGSLLPRFDDRVRPLLEPAFLVTRAKNAMGAAGDVGRPFFVVYFSSTTHLPYRSRPPHPARFQVDDYAGEHRFESAWSAEDFFFDPDPPRPDPTEIEAIRAAYDAAVRTFDDEFGELVSFLEEEGLAENTWIVVTADHGDDLFEPGTTLGHGRSFLGGDQGTHVPLAISGPGVVPGRHAASVGLVDLAPTLLELAGLPLAAGANQRAFGAVLRGTSPLADRTVYAETTYLFAPPVEPGALEVETDAPALLVEPELGEYFALDPRYHEAVLAAKLRMARTTRWKLVRTPLAAGGFVDRLYDVSVDPTHQRDVAGDHPEVARRLGEFLDRSGEARD